MMMVGFPYIFTFYSFKGGVGRSMALLNTAYTLAGWGKHVLILDMDLEAPGVSGFLHRHEELAPASVDHPLDILTLLGEVVAASRKGLQAKQIAESLPPLQNYLRQIAPEKLTALAPKFGTVGRLDIVAADMERDWCRRLAELGLQGMPQDRLIEISRALHFYFKAHRFSHRPFGLEDFEPMQLTAYDYILIDSRTGITEVGGLCVGPLADRLVVLSSLNDQNVEGTLAFLKEAGIAPERRSKKATPWDEADLLDDSEVPTLGPKPTILVASPVPNGEIEFKRKRLAELEKQIGIRPSRLSYHPQMALMESVFVRDYKDEYLAREYLELANAITMQVGDHPGQLASRIFKLEGKKPAEAALMALRLASQQADLGQSLLIQCGNDFKPVNDGEFLIARRLHAMMASVSGFRDVALYNWGNVLSDQAQTKEGEEANRLFAEAGAKYAEALKHKPDKHEALYNWGTALLAQAKTKEGEEADRLFAEAGEKYAEALKHKPDKHDALNNWGNALLAQAQTKEGEEADRLFAEAGAKYAVALKHKPDDHEVLYNWGNALLAQTKTKEGKEADRLFEEAGAKYAEALKHKPDDHKVLNNWGAALSDQAQTKEGEEAELLYSLSREKFLSAESIKQGAAAFNLACLEARLQNEAEAAEWITLSNAKGGRITAKTIAEDSDFDRIRSLPSFKSFVETLPEF